MKKRLGKVLVLGVIFIFLGVALAPSLNAISIPRDHLVIKDLKNSEAGDVYYICIVDITTIGTVGQLTWGKDFGGYFFLADNASITIRALFAYVGYIWRTNYKLTLDSGVHFGLIRGFIGQKSSFQLMGFANFIMFI